MCLAPVGLEGTAATAPTRSAARHTSPTLALHRPLIGCTRDREPAAGDGGPYLGRGSRCSGGGGGATAQRLRPQRAWPAVHCSEAVLEVGCAQKLHIAGPGGTDQLCCTELSDVSHQKVCDRVVHEGLELKMGPALGTLITSQEFHLDNPFHS